MSYVYGNTTRLTGLASGMDTDTIIANLMKIEQTKVNSKLRSQTLLTWKQESLTSVKDDINGFKDNFLSVLGANSMLKSSSYVNFKVSTKDTTNAVTIAAGASNTAKSITVDSVKQLAAAAKSQSVTDPTTNRGNVMRTELAEGNNVRLGELALTNALEFDANGKFSFEVNGETFTFGRNDTLQSMLSTVSNNENAGVVLNFSRLSNTFTLQTKETGADASLSMRNITGNALGADGAFQLPTTDDEGLDFRGQNAIAVIEGVTVEQSKNTFTYDGITFTLNKVTDEDADPIEFTIEADHEPAVEAIKEFVSGYNALIKKLQNLTAEKKSTQEKKYEPLTDDEKASMTETQIEQWETIAKKGLLYNDSDIKSLLTSLRNGLYETVESTGMSLSQLGLKTGNYFEGYQGEIVLDEDKLRAALEEDAIGVMNTFMAAPSSYGAKDGGFIYKLQDTFDNYTKVTQYNTMDSLDRQLKTLTSRITEMEDRMASLEESYYLKFSAMETALSELQSQSQNLASLLGSN